jgi:hypothetical protein
MAGMYVVAPPEEENEPTSFDHHRNGNIDDEDDRNMDEIAKELGDTGLENDDDVSDDDDDAEMASPTPRGDYVVPSGAIPVTQTGALSSHAAEFWFPESRSCVCCNGFKHGCRCTKENKLSACKECAGACANPSELPQPNSSFIVTPPPAIADPHKKGNELDEDERNLAELDKEIGLGDYDDDQDEDDFDEEVPTDEKPGVIPSGAMPVNQSGRLNEHAAEFWFPNCRDCTCCKGFKYGCPCTRERSFLACQDATCNIDANEKDVKSSKPNTPKSAKSPSGSAATLCRFESAPGGCMNGANCRFRHANPVNGSSGAYYGQMDPNMMYPPPSMSRSVTFPSAGGVSDVAVCRFFLSGGCMYGESCRYKHGY